MADVDYTEIPAPSRQCMVCGRDLADVMKHPSVLTVGEGGDPERGDVCPECWEKIVDGDFFSFWLTQREAPKPDTRLTREQQRTALLRLFEQFHASGDKRFRIHVYVLAHLLMKWRLLVWEGTEVGEDGVARVMFRYPATEDRIGVEEIDLADESLVAVKREIDTALALNSTDQSDEDAKRNDADPGAPDRPNEGEQAGPIEG